jgi:hypothetical protein
MAVSLNARDKCLLRVLLRVLEHSAILLPCAYGDVEIPVYQRVNGNQIVAPVLFKMVASYTF